MPAFQLPRSVNLDLAKTPTRMLRSMRAGREVLDDVAADVVVGFGGYVAVPAYLAAWRRHTPIVIHEVNVPPGVANRLGMRFTKHIAVGFPYQPQVSPLLKDARVVGVPLRSAIATLDRAAQPGRGPRALRAGPAPADAVRVRGLAGRAFDQSRRGRRGQGDHRGRDPGAARDRGPQRGASRSRRTCRRRT